MTKLFIALVVTMLGLTAFAQSQIRSNGGPKNTTKVSRGVITVTGAPAEAMMTDMENDLQKQDPSVSVFTNTVDVRILVRDTQSAYVECKLEGAHGSSTMTPEYSCTLTAL